MDLATIQSWSWAINLVVGSILVPAAWGLLAQVRSLAKRVDLLELGIAQRPTETEVNRQHYQDVNRIDIVVARLDGRLETFGARLDNLGGDIRELRDAINRQTDILTDAVKGNR